MEKPNIFIDKERIDNLFDEEKYKNCMDKKHFEYIVSNGKIEYIDNHLKKSKNKQIIESLVLKEKVVKLVDRLSVRVENKRYIGELENSGIDNIEISEEIVYKYHNQILSVGVFALVKLEENTDKKYQYYIEEIEVLEDVNIDLDEYKKYFSERVKRHRRNDNYMSMDDTRQIYEEISEIDLVLNTIGISTKELTFWEKILFLVRLIPLCESNYNLMELGGTGIGKTKTYSMFSPECEIVHEMSVTDLIYNKQSKISGLLKTKDVIVFDEINKLKLDGDKERIIPQLLNFMADGQTTAPRKVISKTSLVFSGNVMGIQERLEKNDKDIFDKSHKLEDDAFLDRIHFFLPAWGLRRYSKNIHGLGISKDVFRFDYFSKALSLLRDEDYSALLDQRRYVITGGSEREVRAIRKTVSGLIKLTHPDKEIDDFRLEAYIAIAIKGRGLVNKFLNNKNKKNVSKIDIEVVRISYGINGQAVETRIPVNEMLKQLIDNNHLEEINIYVNLYKNDRYKQLGVNGGNSTNLPWYLIKKYAEGDIFHSGKFYPNRHVLVFNSKQNQGNIVFIKLALDKMGIQKNKREEKTIKEVYGNESRVGLLNKGRTLMFENQGKFNIPNFNFNFNSEIDINVLHHRENLNYDELFGDQSLDINDFTGTNLNAGTRNLEADFSNFYFIDRNKKLKCENGDYVIPSFKYSIQLDKYYYEYLSEKDNNPKKRSEMMTYVEFKYFLSDNGVIVLN